MDKGAAKREVIAGEAAAMARIRGCDPREIDHFNRQAELREGNDARRWLHRYNPLRLSFTEAMAVRAGLTDAARGLRGLRILDVGCGTGIFCQALARAGGQVRGIDPAMAAILLARREAPTGTDLHYDSAVVSDETVTYDVVTAMEVIEHVPDAGEFLRECAARVRPGGILVLSTINRTVQSWIFAIAMAEYVLGLLPRGAHEWRRFVTPAEAEAALKDCGFRTLSCWGATMNLRSRHMQRSQGTGVNYLLAMQRIG
jgi:2-polyprenyl-6-hydroxyphenyl methylase/3-demethylubiquinone-9 3-methyltransferase